MKKGKRHADHIAMSRKAGMKSNLSGCPKGSKTPGPNYGHVKTSKKSATTIFRG